MYHSWGSQNAWLRQIAARNYLYLHPDTANKYQICDLDWVHVDSHQGRITVQCKFATNMQPDTVWTWNAIGKRRGAWKLAANAPEATQGQAAWFDLRVRIEKADLHSESAPQFSDLNFEAADNSPLRYGETFRQENDGIKK